jgi:hypothetical protein
MRDLAAAAGCSYPTIIAAMNPLIAEGLIDRGSNRSVQLVRYSRARWAELISTSRNIYPPLEFVDTTGQSPSPESLIKRLYKLDWHNNPHVALGGAAAARYWDRKFDLHGIPRIDLVVQEPADLSFIQKLDPALVIRSGPHAHRSPVLVIHRINRPVSLFVPQKNKPLPWADPVETILHLNEMGLTAQAGEMVARLRPESAPFAAER